MDHDQYAAGWGTLTLINAALAQGKDEAASPGFGVPAHDDLVRGDLTATGPNLLWLTDISEHRPLEGKLYICAIKDAWSNRIVGYSISDRMESKIAVDALNNAVARRAVEGQSVAGCTLHSDRGSQLRVRKLQQERWRHKLVGSMGQVGAAEDNAAMEASSRCCRSTPSTASDGPLATSFGSRS